MAISRYKSLRDSKDATKPVPKLTIRDRESDLHLNYNLAERLDVLSFKVYGDPGYWWVILSANPQYTTEFDITIGDLIRVPLPLNDVIDEVTPQLG